MPPAGIFFATVDAPRPVLLVCVFAAPRGTYGKSL